jgi:hypothetical protein
MTGDILEEPGPCMCSAKRDGSHETCARMGWRDTPYGPRGFFVSCGGHKDGTEDQDAKRRADEADERRYRETAGPPRGSLQRGG